MRILFTDTCSSFPLAPDAPHRSSHLLLHILAQRPDLKCMALVPKLGFDAPDPAAYPGLQDLEALGVRSFRIDDDRWFFDCGYPVVAVGDVPGALPDVVRGFRPTVVFSRTPRPPRPIAGAPALAGTPVFHFVDDPGFDPASLRQAHETGGRLLATSKLLQHLIVDRTGLEVEIFYPVVPKSERPPKEGRREAITLLDPRSPRVLDLMLHLVSELPSEPFLVVAGPATGATPSEGWQRLAAAPNVEVVPRVVQLEEVFARSRVLLLPASEAKRQAPTLLEAQAWRVPVVAGGGDLPEVLGDGGVAVAEGLDAGAWSAALGRVLAEHEAYATAARANATSDRFCAETAAERLLELCQDAAAPAVAS